MRFTLEQYDAAIADLQAAKAQLEPDANPCAVCGDSGHVSYECGFNPLVAMFLCKQIAEFSGDLHDMLHYLAGYDIAFGVQRGPAKVILPAREGKGS